jgi:glucose-fructose oxidoreductase
VLPAFAHARENSELVALISGDGKMLNALSNKYKVPRTYSDEQYANCLSDGIDVANIALANSLHRPYAESAARAGVYVLCEKPMAVTEQG